VALRTNLAFAALQLNEDLGFSAYVYGLGSSIFFLSYSLFQACASQCGKWDATTSMAGRPGNSQALAALPHVDQP
jgi:hypothetical protein